MDGAPRARAELERLAWVTPSRVSFTGPSRPRCVREQKELGLCLSLGLADDSTARIDALWSRPAAVVADAHEQ
jgi:hypothetical protein